MERVMEDFLTAPFGTRWGSRYPRRLASFRYTTFIIAGAPIISQFS